MVKEERYDDGKVDKGKKRKNFDEIGYNREKDRRRRKLRYDKENKGFKAKRFQKVIINEPEEDELFGPDDFYDYPE